MTNTAPQPIYIFQQLQTQSAACALSPKSTRQVSQQTSMLMRTCLFRSHHQVSCPLDHGTAGVLHRDLHLQASISGKVFVHHGSGSSIRASTYQRSSSVRIGRRGVAAMASGRVEQMTSAWLAMDKQPSTRAEVEALLEKGDTASLDVLMSTRLQFGTAGLRGRMGAGFSRMNHITVQQTSQGLCCYLQATVPDALAQRGIVVGYDGRHHSREYACITAAVFVSKGFPVALFSCSPVPTPWVAAGVAELGAAAGIMVTASHNPAPDNGYKVYWGNGCQIIPPHDEGIAAAIESDLQLWPLLGQLLPQNISSHSLVTDPTRLVSDAYYSRLARLHFVSDAENAAAQQAVYTPLHGVGAGPARRAFEVFHLPSPAIVPRQEHPDPDFPTVSFPNPEEGKGTWALSWQEGDARGLRLAIANDPDADRLSVAEKQGDGSWQAFTGNEIGVLLADWIWTNHQRLHPKALPSTCAMLSSAVSSRMLASMARAEGFHHEETLTGFKWLGNRAIELEADGERQVLFAFEEAIGFMLGGMYKDKDGISAAAVFAELAGQLHKSRSSVSQRLLQLYQKYGHFAYRASYFIADSPASSTAVFQRLSAGGQYASSIGGLSVVAVRDLGAGLDTAQADRRPTLPWRAGDLMITYTLEGRAWITVRASGTEPKLKYYLEVSGPEADHCGALADRLAAAVGTELIRAQEAGLRLPAT